MIIITKYYNLQNKGIEYKTTVKMENCLYTTSIYPCAKICALKLISNEAPGKKLNLTWTKIGNII